MSAVLLQIDSNGLATLTLNRPQKLNALNVEVFQQLDEHLTAMAAQTDSIGAVLIRGAGKCFSAGLDMTEAASDRPPVSSLFMAQVVGRLSNLPQPVLAAVHGHCYTGALELAMAADIVLAAETARFGDTHSKWGLTPAWGMSQRLPRRVGYGQACRMMFTAESIGGQEAHRIGLVDLLFPEASFDTDVGDLARKVVDNSWFSHRGNKQLLRQTDGLPLSAGLAYEFFNRAGRAPDFEERIARFSKR